MKLTFTLFFLFCGLQMASAWTEFSGNIRGIVTNQESGQVIRGATVKLVPFNDKNSKFMEKSFSQDAGEFLFNDIKPGLYDLECSAFGFKTTRLIGVQIREDRTKLAYFKMERGSAAEIMEIFTYAALEAKQKASTETSTANKESLEDAPATIYVITAEDIEDNGYMSLNEILADIPEFEIQYRSNGEVNNIVSARGIYGNEKLLILKDGHRYNSMVSTNYSLMENYGVRYAKRVEVILGPASALYGADAYMGVVNIITEKGNNRKAANLTGSYGNYNTTSNAIAVGGGTDKISFALDVGFFYTEGANLNEAYTDEFRFYNRNYLTNGTIVTSPFQPGATQTLPIKPFSMERRAFYLNARFDYKKFNLNVSLNREQHNSSVGTLPQYSPYWLSSIIGTSIININLHQDYAFKKGSKWSASTDLTNSLVARTPGSNFVNSFSSYKKAYKVGVDVGGRLRQMVGFRIHKKHSITAGIEFQHSTALPQTSDLPRNYDGITALQTINTAEEDIYYLGTNFLDTDNNSLKIYQNFYYLRRFIGAGFLEYRGNIGDKLLITVGTRYDQIVDISEYARREPKPVVSYFNISPRVGLVYKPFKNFNVKAFFGQGFLQPSPERKYDHFGTFLLADDRNSIRGTFWRTPNPNLAPEQVQTIELSTSYSKGDFTIGLNSYYNTILNPITYVLQFSDQNNQLNFLGIPIETEEISINGEDPIIAYGTTINGAYRLVYGKEEQFKIRFRASYSFADGHITGSNNIPYTARHTAKAGVLFKYYNFSLSNSFLFRTESYSNNITDSDGNTFQYQSVPFFIWNAFARYKVLDKKKLSLSIFVKVNNVLDNRYYNVTDNTSIALGASPQDPIRFLAGVSFNFGRKK
ncbi:MAG: TonB-dependent receptor [Aureispira sp.]